MPSNSDAVWVSHSSMGDFLKCPRLYFLRNVYKNPKTNKRWTIMTPPLALGQAVHEVIEGLAALPREERFKDSLEKKFEVSWEKVSGEKGGFKTKIQEDEYKERGMRMILRVKQNPGVLANKAVKIKPREEDGRISDFQLPRYKLSAEDNIILCGKVDWLEYLEADNAVHIVDFKTGKNEEDSASLQLPIYLLLTKNCQKYAVSKASYWYINQDDAPKTVELPDEKYATEEILKVAKRIKLARSLNLMTCEKGGCKYCLPFEALFNGGGKFVGMSDMGQEIYIL
jgi:ATP-dependent helicase/DNAse subunit B